MDLREHQEVVNEAMPQGLRTPAYLAIGAAVCLFQALSGLLCDPRDSKLGKFADLDPNWSHATTSMMLVGVFGAILLAIMFIRSRRRPLLSAVMALVGFVALVATLSVRDPGALVVGVYIYGNLLLVLLLVAACVVAAREEAKIRRALDRQTRLPPDAF